MAKFDEIRDTLNGARAETHELERQLFKEKQRMANLLRELRKRQRSGETGDLDLRIRSLGAEIQALQARLSEQRIAEGRQSELFVQFTDPRKNIGRLSDRTPILLMPLRIEIRFKTVEVDNRSRNELWVRVYPDDIFVDVFEDTFSESEVQKARTYWADIWRAAGDEAQERGAWRVFLSGQGSGRSYWMIQNYQPLNIQEKPVKADGVPTVILTIVTQVPLSAAERDVANNFWEALWRADDDGEAATSAYNDLSAAVGAETAQHIQTNYRPRNLADSPPVGATRETTTVIVAHLEFPTDEAIATRASGWSQAPHVNTLPDRLVLLGYRNGEKVLELIGNPIPSPLAVGPDPSAEPEDQIRKEGAGIKVDDGMAWVTDFGKAIDVGMAFRVPLSTDEFRLGFDKLLVLGVRLRANAASGKAELEELITHHHASKAGFSLLPQGRPTNNVEGEGSAYSWQEDADVSFNHYFGKEETKVTEGFAKSDGRRLAEMLGLDPRALRGIPFYRQNDIGDAQALNTALWPATLGYFMDAMMQPVFDDDTVAQTREFFTRHVSARGHIPAIRVGKQPYGILPATCRSRIEWLFERATVPSVVALRGFNAQSRLLQNIYRLLRRMEVDFEPLLNRVSYVGKAGDPLQILLDVVGLHAGSVEYQQRYAESISQVYNRLAMQGAGGAFVAALITLGYVASGFNLLKELGYVAAEGAKTPDILEKLFVREPNLLKGHLIDDVDLSETSPIRGYTETGENYIAWLIRAASTSHDALRLQQGFKEGTPTALLYLMLHHALDLSYVETSIRLFFNAGLIDSAGLEAAKREPKFMQVTELSLANPAEGGGSRWQYLYRKEAAVTGTANRTIGEFIPTILTTMTATAYLKRQLDALEHLKNRPTAALERVFAEHLDLCTYRFDAWYGGLLSVQLEELRNNPQVPEVPDAQGEPTEGGEEDAPDFVTGLHLGAYGWLENVRPEFKRLEPVALPDELADIFSGEDEPPLVRDNKNQGYIHAPSLNHAVTAAVLRNGYLSNATPQNSSSFAINLSSERVRMALQIIQGMQAEQSLGGLLGYQFERGLHDRHDVEVDEFIYDLRKTFPLVGDRLTSTRTGKTDQLGRKLSIRRVEAHNVIDGLALAEHVRKPGNGIYPFGFADLPPASPAQRDAISQEAGRIVNLADAVADLAMAESVHQVVQGNYDRAGAVLDTYSKGKFPAMPDVARTPRSGVTLHHRVALHLPVGLDPADPALTSPRAQAEPAINAWLASLLPAADRVACSVTVTDPLDGSVMTATVTQQDLGLLPADLLYLLDSEAEGSASTLDDLIESRVIAILAPRPHAQLAIRYRERIPAIAGHVTFFELSALIRPLRGLLLRSRPLRGTDMTLSQEGSEDMDADLVLAPQRITLVRDQLQTRLAGLTAFHAALQARIDAEQAPQIISEIDVTVDSFVGLMLALTPFASFETGTSAIHADRRRIFAALLDRVAALVDRWSGKLDEFDQAIVSYDANPTATDQEKFLALQMAERLVAADRTDPLPPLPDTYRDDLITIRRAALAAQRDGFANLHATALTLSGLHDAVAAAIPVIANLDPADGELEPHSQQILLLAEDMAKRAAALIGRITAQLAEVQKLLDAAATEVAGKKKIGMLTQGARRLLGENFQILPDFRLPEAQAVEWGNAWGLGAEADTAILDYLQAEQGRRWPVEDWFAGIARVREKVHDLETVGHLTQALTAVDIPLQPLQFPWRPDTPWLALEFPETKADGTALVIDEDKLLYTAHFTAGFDSAQRQAGLLLDEWTEVIPNRSLDTGLAFHYDRPNSEPPQTLLLALPPRYTGGWQWQDLVDTVHETMDLAKKRAIEPDHIDTTAYARFLPAVISAVTLYPITASLNFAFNNNLAAVLAKEDGT